jgi:hypothetical protein
MALFGSARDASLVRSVNRELINNYIDTEVGFYKLNTEVTKTNIYDESDNKVYYSVMKMNSIILRESRTQQADDFGIDYTRPVTFGFIRDDLKDKNIVIETGDIIEYNGEYHEVDSVSSSEFFAGKNPSRDLGFTLGERDEFGLNVSVIVESHVTRKNRLNIQEVRSGINRPMNNIPRNL